MVVQHNISAMTANRYYGINNSSLGKSLEKLSSGYAINRAGDNAAGLAVSEKMRAQIQGLTQASKNAQDGISMVQTYEGALQETDSILQRMRTIAVQSANGSYQNDVDRDALQLEFDQLNDELNQIADTDFNGVVVLNGGVMADGTIANDTSKVAERPTVADIKATPNASFTYNSSVNGTVDSGGNGSFTINGVSVQLSSGVGDITLGSEETGGVTNYSVTENNKITVNNGKVSGTITAKESYKVDESTTKVEIHGQSYTLAKGDNGWGIFDDSGKQKDQIDGLAVSVTKNSDGSAKAVQLEGNYVIDQNIVSTSKKFEATDSEVTNSNKADITNWKGTADISAINVKYSTDGNTDASGKVTINSNVTLNVSSGTGSKTVDGLTYTISGFDANSNTDEVAGTVQVSGNATTTTKNKAALGTNFKDTVTAEYDSGNGTDLKAAVAYEGKTASYTFKDNITGNNVTLYAKCVSEDGGSSFKINLYSDEGCTDKIGDSSTTTLYMNYDGEITGTAEDDSVSELSISMDANGTLTLDDQEWKEMTSAGVGSEFKAFINTAGDKFAQVNGANGYVMNSDNNLIGLKNGLEVAVGGAVKGDFTFSDTLESTEVGSFKVSKGVSTSDTFNHGTANLTFADNMTLQVGARSKDAVTFNFSYTTNGIGNLKSDLNASARGLGTDQVSVRNQEDANAAIDAIDNAINKVSMIRGTFGAIQNRLEHKINNIDTNTENLTAAESRIRDTQMDQEMMKFTSSQILSQASQSMLAQANSLPQGVLQLLG